MTDIKGEASLGACITGAGPAHAELRHTDAGATEVVCTARTAGDYVLSVFDLFSGASLFGSPYQVRQKYLSCLQIYLVSMQWPPSRSCCHLT